MLYRKGTEDGGLCRCAGFRVGRQLAERCTWDRPRLVEQLDVMKFICKEFWIELFQKQVLSALLQCFGQGVFGFPAGPIQPYVLD